MVSLRLRAGKSCPQSESLEMYGLEKLTGNIRMVPEGPGAPSAPGKPGRPGGPCEKKRERKEGGRAEGNEA